MVFGVWCLVFGVWGLGFGVCLDLALIKLFEDFAVGLSVGPLPSEKESILFKFWTFA